jgi:hypothetical protein
VCRDVLGYVGVGRAKGIGVEGPKEDRRERGLSGRGPRSCSVSWRQDNASVARDTRARLTRIGPKTAGGRWAGGGGGRRSRRPRGSSSRVRCVRTRGAVLGASHRPSVRAEKTRGRRAWSWRARLPLSLVTTPRAAAEVGARALGLPYCAQARLLRAQPRRRRRENLTGRRRRRPRVLRCPLRTSCSAYARIAHARARGKVGARSRASVWRLGSRRAPRLARNDESLSASRSNLGGRGGR